MKVNSLNIDFEANPELINNPYPQIEYYYYYNGEQRFVKYSRSFSDQNIEDLVKHVAKFGTNNRLIRKKYGVGNDVFRAFKEQDPRIKEALKQGMDIYNEKQLKQAEKALNKLVDGYKYKEKTVKTLPNGDKEITEKWVEKAPNVTATIFKLCNIKDSGYQSINNIQQVTNNFSFLAENFDKVQEYLENNPNESSIAELPSEVEEDEQ